jgi:hypothetical protein
MFQRTVSLWRQLLHWVRQPRRAATEPDSGDERRVWARRLCDAQVFCQPAAAADAQRYSARVRNISRGGISLCLDHRFEPGALLTVELPTEDGRSTFTVLACVVHLRSLADGKWALGCSFSRELSDDDLVAFGAKRVRPAPPDLRTWMRFPSGAQATMQTGTAAGQEPWPAQLRDISANGVALLVAQPVEAGTILSLELQRTAAPASLTLLACVVRVEGTPGGEWLLGCTFIRELSDKELRALT